MARDDDARYPERMRPLKARVEKGRFVIDEAIDLPEGEIVYLHPVELAVDGADDFDDEERAALHAALDEGIAAYRRGEHFDAEELVSALLARK